MSRKTDVCQIVSPIFAVTRIEPKFRLRWEQNCSRSSESSTGRLMNHHDDSPPYFHNSLENEKRNDILQIHALNELEVLKARRSIHLFAFLWPISLVVAQRHRELEAMCLTSRLRSKGLLRAKDVRWPVLYDQRELPPATTAMFVQ